MRSPSPNIHPSRIALVSPLLVLAGAGVIVSVVLALVPDPGDASLLQRTVQNLKIYFTLDYADRTSDNFPLVDVLLHRSGVSFTLIGGALALVLSLGVPTGILAALRGHNRLVQAWVGLLYTVSATPILVLGILAVTVATRLFGLPPYRLFLDQAGPGGTVLIYLIPLLTLALGDGLLGDVTRNMQTATARRYEQPYLQAVQARGLSLRPHLIRGLLPPLVGTMAGKITYLISGSVVVEYIFGWQGLGYQVLDILTTDGTKDYPFILAATTLFVGITVLLNLLHQVVLRVAHPHLHPAPVAA